MTLVGRVYNYLEIGHRKQVKVVCLPLTRSIAARTMVVSISHRSYSNNVCYHFRRPVSTSAAKLQVEGYEKRNKKTRKTALSQFEYPSYKVSGMVVP